MHKNVLKDTIDFYNKNFIKLFTGSFNEFNSDDFDNSVWFTGPTSYLFKLNGTRFAVDLQIRRSEDLQNLADRLIKDCEKIPFVLITHQHGDHMCFPLIKLLKDTDTKWYLPYGTLQKYIDRANLDSDKIVFVKDGDEWEIDGIHFRAFYSPHKKVNDEIFPQCGYEIVFGDKKILIPSDIRDYSYNGYPDFNSPDFCFSNVWGGNDSLSEELYGPMLNDFAKCSSRFGAKRYFLCHLYEIGREEDKMWNNNHAETAKKLIEDLLVTSKVDIPTLGQRIYLGNKQK